jgi:hypothetical protein
VLAEGIRRGKAQLGYGVGMTALVRFMAGIVLLTAVIFAVNDATRAQASGRANYGSIYETWSSVSPATLNAARGAVQRYTHPLVWNWGVAKPLQLPAWVLLGVVGLMLAYVGRRRRRVNIYAN